MSVKLGLDASGYKSSIEQASNSTKAFTNQVTKIKASLPNLKKEYMSVNRETLNLTLAVSRLTKEQKQSAEGRQMIKMLEETKAKAAELKDMILDTNDEIKQMASDTQQLDIMAEGFGVIGNSLSGVAGAVSLFTGEQEDLNKAIAMFTTVESTAAALTKVQNALQHQSAIMIAIRNVQQKAATAAINLETAAKGKNIVVTKAAEAAQWALNKAAYANPYVLLAMAIIGVAAALTAFCVMSRKSKDAQEAETKATERAKAVKDAYYDAYNSNLSETMGSYTKLQVEWKNLKSESEKNQWIKDNTDAFHDLGFEITGTSDAESFFVQNEAQVIASFVARAEAAALAAQQVEIFNQALKDLPQVGDIKSAEWFDKQGLSTSGRKDMNKGFLRFDYKYEVTQSDLGKLREDRLANARKTAKQLGELQLKAEQKANTLAAKAGVKTYNEERKKELNKSGGKKIKVEPKIDDKSLEYAQKHLKELEEQRIKMSIDSPDLPRVKKDIDKWKDEVQRRKIILGLEVEPTASEKLQNIEKALQDVAKEAEAAYKLASKEGKANVLELYDAWQDAKQALENYLETTKLLTEGFTVTAPNVAPIMNEGTGKIDPNTGNPYKELRKDLDTYTSSIDILKNSLNTLDFSNTADMDAWERRTEKIRELRVELESMQGVFEQAIMTPTEQSKKKIEEMSSSIQSVGNAISAAGDMFSALGDLADDTNFNIMGIVAKAIATVALSFAQALTTAKSWVDWLAFGATGLATMLSMISQIKSATAGGYAGGGIIPGGSYSGDKLIANVNSGEMILNRRQQSNLFNAIDHNKLSTAGQTNVVVEGVIRGKDLILVQKQTRNLAKNSPSLHF